MKIVELSALAESVGADAVAALAVLPEAEQRRIADVVGRLAEAQAGTPLWIFGYGSLMWRPGFPVTSSHLVRIYGFHRALCVWSWYHRGTPRHPGLVLGLDRGGMCTGRAFQVPTAAQKATIAYLCIREMVTPAYLPRHVAARPLQNGQVAPDGMAQCLTFIVDRRHPQYAGKLSSDIAADVVAGAIGASGDNDAYLYETLACLDHFGIAAADLQAIGAHLKGAQLQGSQS